MEKTTKKSVKRVSVDHLKRIQAEFENTVKRLEKEKQALVEYASQELILKLLPILDDFERALEVAKKTQEKELISGLEMLYKQFYALLQENGLKPIESINKTFDPYKHEVVQKIDSNQPENTIIEEIQRGYYLKDRIIRHSKVKISNGNNMEVKHE